MPLSALLTPNVLKVAGIAAELGEMAMMWRLHRAAAGAGTTTEPPPGTDARIIAALDLVKKYAEVKENDSLDDVLFGGLLSALFSDRPPIERAAITGKITGFINYLETKYKLADRFRYNMFRLRNEELGGPDVLKAALEDIANEPDDASRYALVSGRGWLKGGNQPIVASAERVVEITQSLLRTWTTNIQPVIITVFGIVGSALDSGAFGVGGNADNPAADSAVGAVREFRAGLQDRKTELRARLAAQQNPPAGGNTGNNQNQN